MSLEVYLTLNDLSCRSAHTSSGWHDTRSESSMLHFTNPLFVGRAGNCSVSFFPAHLSYILMWEGLLRAIRLGTGIIHPHINKCMPSQTPPPPKKRASYSNTKTSSIIWYDQVVWYDVSWDWKYGTTDTPWHPSDTREATMSRKTTSFTDQCMFNAKWMTARTRWKWTLEWPATSRPWQNLLFFFSAYFAFLLCSKIYPICFSDSPILLLITPILLSTKLFYLTGIAS